MKPSLLAYELFLRSTDVAVPRDPRRLESALPNTWGTGVQLMIECLTVLVPAWLATWAVTSWLRFELASESVRHGWVLYFWPELLVFVGALPFWLHVTIWARRDRGLRLSSRLANSVRPFLRLWGLYLGAVAVTYVVVDVDLSRDLAGFFTTHGLAYSVAVPLQLVGFYSQFAETGDDEAPVYSGYRILTPARVVDVSRAACVSHVETYRDPGGQG